MVRVSDFGFTIMIEIFKNRYNVIGLFETMKEDVEFIMRAAAHHISPGHIAASRQTAEITDS